MFDSANDNANTRSKRAGPIVLKIGGSAIESPTEALPVAAAIAALHRWWAPGVVVVHGGGSEIDRHLARLGIVSEKRDGIRITPQDSIEEIVAVLAGKTNKRLVGQLQAHDVPAVGLCLGDGRLMRTEKATHYSFDAGYVGQTVGGNPLLIEVLIGNGFLPVLCSIGLDAAGLPLNINADDAAADVACLLDASTLMLLTDVPGVLDVNGAVLPLLHACEVEQRIACGEIAGGMVAKVRSAAKTAVAARMPVTIASWRDASKIDQLAHDAWFGTRILPDGMPGRVRQMSPYTIQISAEPVGSLA